VTAAVLLRVIGLVLASLLVPAAASAQTAAPSTVPRAAPCAPTIDQILARYNLRPRIEETTFETFGLAVFTLKNEPVATTAWFRRREEVWCLLGLGTDVVAPARGIELGVPEPIAWKLIAQQAALRDKRQ
jgi:hypothetical protein